MASGNEPTIMIVSDGRGVTCGQVVRAALVQFEGQPYRTVVRPEVQSPERAREVVAEAAELQAVVFSTLVLEDVRTALRLAAEEKLVPAVDLFAHALPALHDLFQTAPSSRPGLLYESDREYFDRIEAIDYTLKHDDGQRAHELADADVVLVGVSRASKSTTCFYLAYQGIRAANVPLFPDIEPPSELLALPAARVIGLKINLMRLQVVREARTHGMGSAALGGYTDKREIAREIRSANDRMRRHGWRSVDVSYKAIEEIGREVLRLAGRRHP